MISPERCDDGNFDSLDGCDFNCTIEDGYNCIGNNPSVCSPICGDGKVILPESCDDGIKLDSLGCNITCDGTILGFECTAGSSTSASLCQPNCGDSLILSPEKCDDGNKRSFDGCNETCQVETYWSCLSAG